MSEDKLDKAFFEQEKIEARVEKIEELMTTIESEVNCLLVENKEQQKESRISEEILEVLKEMAKSVATISDALKVGKEDEKQFLALGKPIELDDFWSFLKRNNYHKELDIKSKAGFEMLFLNHDIFNPNNKRFMEIAKEYLISTGQDDSGNNLSFKMDI